MKTNKDTSMHPQGYYTIVNKPTPEELSRYYADKYYQNGTIQYPQQYEEEELDFVQNEPEEYIEILKTIFNKSTGKVLDVGCGEGWVLRSFMLAGWQVCGLDYSSFAISKFNNNLLTYFIQGDFTDLLPSLNDHFDFIILKNVIEHAIDPALVICEVGKRLKKGGVIMIRVPNDFSKLQQYLMAKKMVLEEFWVSPPAHLNYFTHSSLNQFMLKQGFEVVFESSDYPIDLDLLVPGRNYKINTDPNLGKAAHLQRIRTENFMRNQSISGLVSYHQALARMGLGRNVVSFYKKLETK